MDGHVGLERSVGDNEVPRQSHSPILRSPWHRCDRCGWDYPVTELVRQLGLILCPYDVDNTIAWTRPLIIQDVINFTGDEELRVAEILTENASDDLESISE